MNTFLTGLILLYVYVIITMKYSQTPRGFLADSQLLPDGQAPLSHGCMRSSVRGRIRILGTGHKSSIYCLLKMLDILIFTLAKILVLREGFPYLGGG